MDGRGRLLRSLRLAGLGASPAALAYAGALQVPGAFSERAATDAARAPEASGLRHKILNRLAGPGTGACLSLLLLAAVGGYGAVKGGHYAAFVAAQGQPADLVAKALGFSIKSVTISGERELKEQDLLTLAGIGPRNSLLFLDVGENPGKAATASARQGSSRHQALPGPALDRDRGAAALRPVAVRRQGPDRGRRRRTRRRDA